MKKNNWVAAATLLLLTACQNNASGSLTLGEDGTVTGADGKKLQLDIQSIYDNLNYDGLNYFAGFKIDEEGTNHPYIARVGGDVSVVNYWSFEKIPNDIFVYQKNVHLVTTDGHVYSFEKGEWNLIKLTFPKDSQVVFSDDNSNLIICYPAALEKAVLQQSGCKSLNNQWQQDFVWHTQVPKMCDGNLYAVAQEKDSNIFKRIDITTGKEISSRLLKQIPKDLCSL